MRREIEFYRELQSGKCLSFVIERKNAKTFKTHTERLNRSEVLISKGQRMFGKAVAYIYASYVGLVGFSIGTLHKDLEVPLLVYATCWRYISFIDGEDLPEGKAKITFCGRRNDTEL